MRGRMSLSKKIEQWLYMKFFVKLGKSGAKINKMLPMINFEDVLKPAMVYMWVKRSHKGCESVDDDTRSGRPSFLHTEDLFTISTFQK